MLMAPFSDNYLDHPTPSFTVDSSVTNDDPASAIHLRRALFTELPFKRCAISSTTRVDHDPSIGRITSHSFALAPQSTVADAPPINRGVPSPLALVKLSQHQPNAAGESPINDTAAPPLIPFNEIPERNLQIIKQAIAEVFRINIPREFQIKAINHLLMNNDTYLILIRRTADGKSLVSLTVATICRGIAIIRVPLIGIGSDQVEKAIVVDHNVEACHADKHKQLDGLLLWDRL